MDENRNTELEETIESLQQNALQPQEPKMPDVWTVGKHQYIRIAGGNTKYPDLKPGDTFTESPLSVALNLLSKSGVKVLGFERFGFWQGGIFHIEWKVKTMAPRENETT